MNERQKQILAQEVEMVNLEILKTDNKIKETNITLQHLYEDKIKLLLKLKELKEE
jgi:hypothetical protein